MLPVAHRLKKDTDISRVLKSRTGVFDVACGVKFAKNDLGVSRFAIMVGSKVSKNAVDRNRVRRQYREIIQAFLPQIKTGFDVLLLTSKPVLELDFQQKQTKLHTILKKGDLFL